jgi:hydrogenase maturation protein HypF
VPADPSLFAILANNELDLLPLVLRIADCRDRGFAAALFHSTLAAALAEWAYRTAAARALSTVVAGGGCMLNALLAAGLRREFASRGVALLEARAVPPNDGGLALGQAWVAVQSLTDR